jgi:hypothetical protein
MSYKFFFFILFLFYSKFSFGQTNYIDPTGVYKLEGKTTKKNGETYGYFGDVKVIAIDKQRILVGFFVCKGAPSYNSGSFVDTLKYINNTAIYTGDPDADSTCKMTMIFGTKGINVTLETEDPNFACGFGHAVDSQGFYYRVKGKIPTKKEILDDDR